MCERLGFEAIDCFNPACVTCESSAHDFLLSLVFYIQIGRPKTVATFFLLCFFP